MISSRKSASKLPLIFQSQQQTMQFLSLIAITLSAISSQVMAGNVAFNVAPLGTRELKLLVHAYIFADVVNFTSQRVATEPPLAALCPLASPARVTSTRSKLPSSSLRPSAIVMSACSLTMTSREASSRGWTRTRLAPAFSRRLRNTRATESSVERSGGW